MAWLYKQKKSKYWWIGWRVGTKCHFRSTKTADRKQAEKELEKVNMLRGAHRAGLLDAVYHSISGRQSKPLPLRAALDEWLAEVSGRTQERYGDIADGFASFMGATADKPLLSEITTELCRDYLNHRRKTCSASTTNMERKILSVFFRRAIKNGQLRENPVFPIRPFEAKGDEVERKKRAFTLAELQLMYRKAPDDFWRYMIVGGTYTGLRMGDLITLAWQSIDFEENMLRVLAGKTRRLRRTVKVPIAKPFREELEQLHKRAGKPRSGFVWPDRAEQYATKKAKVFSNEFYELVLEPCGLVAVRPNKKGTGKGRGAERVLNPISFHSFRHSFVSLLKATGGSQIVAKELAGHSSDLISDAYTTLPPEVLTKAIDGLPMIKDS